MPKAKVIKLKSKKREKEINKIGDLMRNMLQVDSNSDDFSNVNIIFDKYCKLTGLLYEYLTKLTELSVSINNDYYNSQVRRYMKAIRDDYCKFGKLDLTPYRNTIDITTLEVDKLRTLKNHYVGLRDSVITLTAIMVAKNILTCKLDGGSLGKSGRYEEFCDLAFKGDIELRIFQHIKIGELKSIIDFDFCVIFNQGNISQSYSNATKEKIFSTILSLCTIGKGINKIKNSTDVDVADIFPKMVEMIGSFKSKMRGCDRAFSIIEKSADIFEKNCNKYISKATKSGNPMSMFTDFVGDIIKVNTEKTANGEEVGLPIMGELKKILREMRQMVENAGSTMSIPDNVKFIVDIADTIIEEHENNVEGDIPSTQKIRDLQKNFHDIFIP